MRPRATVSALGACAALLSSGCGGPPPPSAPSPLLARAMPDVHRKTLGGADLDTASARGRVVIVDFFAKYCEPCKRSLPELEALHRAQPDVLVVGVGEDENEGDVREVVATLGLSFDVIHDRGNVVSGRYRVSSLPATFVSGADGVMRWVSGSLVSSDDLARVVAAARRAPP